MKKKQKKRQHKKKKTSSQVVKANSPQKESDFSELSVTKSDEQKGQLRATSTTWAAPIPPPNLLGDYNNIIPDGANRILMMAEKEQAAKHKLEEKALNAEIHDVKLGQRYAFVVSLTGFSLIAYVFYLGHVISASIIGTFQIAALVFAFIKGRNNDPNDESNNNSDEASP